MADWHAFAINSAGLMFASSEDYQTRHVLVGYRRGECPELVRQDFMKNCRACDSSGLVGMVECYGEHFPPRAEFVAAEVVPMTGMLKAK